MSGLCDGATAEELALFGKAFPRIAEGRRTWAVAAFRVLTARAPLDEGELRAYTAALYAAICGHEEQLSDAQEADAKDLVHSLGAP